MASKRYPTDLSNAEWSLLVPHLLAPKRRGCPRVHCPPEILNAVRLLEPARSRLRRLIRLWVDAGYRGRGKEWAEGALGFEVEVVNRSPKPTPEKVLWVWAREWFNEGREMDLSKLPTRPGFENLPRRWIAERTFAWISHNRRMAKDYEGLCSTGKAFIHASMNRLMIRRLAYA
jgi:putative transposase